MTSACPARAQGAGASTSRVAFAERGCIRSACAGLEGTFSLGLGPLHIHVEDPPGVATATRSLPGGRSPPGLCAGRGAVAGGFWLGSCLECIGY